MERNIRIDWKTLVEEAIKRRKEARLTQRQLGVLVGVSTPTISRFERQEKNITLASAFAILEFLELVQKT